MTDEQSPPSLPSQLPQESPDASATDLIAFFERVGASEACPICKTNKWNMVSRDHGGGLHLPNPLSSGTVLAVPAYLFVCDNCQFMRMHSKKLIDERIAALAKGSS